MHLNVHFVMKFNLVLNIVYAVIYLSLIFERIISFFCNSPPHLSPFAVAYLLRDIKIKHVFWKYFMCGIISIHNCKNIFTYT
jgi:hypothetical protein